MATLDTRVSRLRCAGPEAKDSCLRRLELVDDGRDRSVAPPAAPICLSCRMYETPDGLAGAPTVEQLVQVMS
jgi:hypothetical protein